MMIIFSFDKLLVVMDGICYGWSFVLGKQTLLSMKMKGNHGFQKEDIQKP